MNTESRPGARDVTPLAPDRTLGLMCGKTHYVADGRYYTTGGFTDIVEGLAAHFAKTILVVPVLRARPEQLPNLRAVPRRGYQIYGLPPHARRTAFAWLRSGFIRREARKAFAECDVLLFGMYAMSTLMAVPEMEAMKKPLCFLLGGEVAYPRKDASGIRLRIVRRMEDALRRHLTFVRGRHLVDIHHLDPDNSVVSFSSTFHESDARSEPNPPPAAGRPIQLIFVGRIDENKGVDVSLRSLAELGGNRRRFHLHVVGDGPARPGYERLARQLKVTDVVTFHGYVPHGDRWEDLMASAHALCFLSLHEGAPKVVVEALRFGMPVLVSWVGAIPAVIQQGVNGWLVEPGQVAPTVQALQAMLEMDTESWAAMSRTNLEVSKQYTIERDARRIVETMQARGLLA